MNRRPLTLIAALFTLTISTSLLWAWQYTLPSLHVSGRDGRDGTSFETALLVRAEDEWSGVSYEYAWLNAHYPFHWFEGQSLAFSDGQPYDVMAMRAPDGTLEQVYFDISSFYGAWE